MLENLNIGGKDLRIIKKIYYGKIVSINQCVQLKQEIENVGVPLQQTLIVKTWLFDWFLFTFIIVTNIK